MNPELERIRRTATMLSGAFFFFVGLLAFQLHQILRARPAPVSLSEAAASLTLHYGAVVAVAAAVASLVVPRLLARATEGNPAERMFTEPGSPEWKRRIQSRFTSHVVGIALAEIPSVFGFVVGLQVGNFEVAVPFFVLTIVLFAFHWPREEKWR